MSNLFRIILFASLALLGSAAIQYTRQKTLTTNGASLASQTYDIIIVGGGLSGLTLANRLSDYLPTQRILVIEAGDDTRKDFNVTSYNRLDAANADKHINWAFNTVLQTQGPSSPAISFILDAGKGLGGGTSINGGLYDAIFKAQAEEIFPGGWEELVDGMKMSQTFHPPSTEQVELGDATYDPQVHGSGGPVDLAFSKSMFLGPHQRAFSNSIRQVLPDLPKSLDHAGGDNVGVGVLPHAIVPDNDNQIRVSSATSFLTPIEDRRPNLTVLTGWRAIKIEWAASSSQRKRAGGVTIQQEEFGPTYQIPLSVKRGQFIVSAGTIRSPFFLEHSGVGAPEVLSRAGIEQQVSLPGVGKNLQEQAFTFIFLPRDASIDMRGTGPQSIKATVSAKYLFPPKDLESLEGEIRSNMTRWAADMVKAGTVASEAGLLEQYELQVEGIFEQGWPVAEILFQPKVDYTFLPSTNMALQAWILVPFSRGKTHASSTSAWDNPELDPMFWSAGFDMKALVAAMQVSRKTFEKDDLKNLSSGDRQEVLPGYNVVTNSQDGGNPEEWEKYIYSKYRPVAHPVGTCSMRPLEKGGVVDEEYKVYGTDNVRVVDASVIAMEVTSHLCGTLYALTEKAAVIIAQASE